MQVANQILQQLGGNRFLAMTGAKNLASGGNDLTFKIGRGAKKSINFVKVTLDASDTYTVDFMNFRGLNVKTIASFSDIYADKLQALFTEQTGFGTHL